MFVKTAENSTLLHSQKSESSKDPDRRYLPRWEVNNKISYRKDNDILYHDCLSKDINCTGACIRTPEDIPVHQNLKLTICLAENIDPIQVHGRVVWQKGHGEEHSLGIQFDRVSDKTSELIYRYAFEFRHDDLVKSWFKGF